MKQFWIKGVLEKSVYDAALLDLGKQTRTEAVEHPWERVLELPDEESRTLPADREIIELFDEFEHALLILGDPGSGKTITLLELARDLIRRAEEDPGQPIPVVFNLSTWSHKRQPLLDWLVEELKAKYYIPERTGRSWLEAHRLVLLLDGLDEVALESRTACVEAINRFVAAFGLPGLLVCSRTEEYTVLPVRLKFNGAICLKPLTLDQVDAYLARMGEALAVLRTTLQTDHVLQTLAQTPLMLSVMSLAYQGQTLETSSRTGPDSVEARRRHLFDTYIQRMFERRGRADPPYTHEQTTAWLSWLAQQLRRHAQSVFLIEGLQPSWLSTSLQRWIYTLGSRLLGGLILGLIFGLTLWLTFALLELIEDHPLRTLGVGLLFGTAGGVIAGFLDGFRFEKNSRVLALGRVPEPGQGAPTAWQTVIDVLVYVLLLGLAGGLIIRLIEGPGTLGVALEQGLMFGLLCGLVFGLLFGVKGRRHSLRDDIQTVEVLGWSWVGARKNAVRRLVSGGVLGLVFGLVLGFLFFLTDKEKDVLTLLMFGLLLGLMGGGVGGLLGALFGGLSRSIVEKKTLPNQGIRLSIRNTVYGGLAVGLTVALMAGLVFGLLGGFFAGVAWGLTWGLFLGLLAGLWYGGLDVLQHYTLRLVLYFHRYTPRSYVRFLDYAAKLIFLRKVGGGYIFIHRSLLEHFAAYGERAAREEAVRQDGGAVQPPVLSG